MCFEKLTFFKLFCFATLGRTFFFVWKNSRFSNYFTNDVLKYIFVFGNTHVFLTIRFPTVARTFFFGRKNSRFFNYFPNDLTIQFCVWKNSRFFNYFVSRLWLLLFSVVEKTHVFSTIFYQRPYTKVLCLEKLTFF